MWNWTWLDEDLCDDKESLNFSDEDVAKESNEEDDDDTSNTDAIPAITHSIIFKCMGSTKKRKYGDSLSGACN